MPAQCDVEEEEDEEEDGKTFSQFRLIKFDDFL